MKEPVQLIKTDSLDWTKINSKIKFSYTKKKFFNEFYFRLNYTVPGARLISYNNTINDIEFKYRILNYNNNSMRWRGIVQKDRLADAAQILDFSRIYHSDDHAYPLKFRIESDQLSIYSNHENYLYKLASTDLGAWQSNILSISLIENDQDRLLLDQGYIISSRPQSHPYKIKIKETFDFDDDRQGLETYLQNLGNNVKVTKYMLERLSLKHKYFPGGYIYVNDHRLVDMLRLVSPNLIGSVQQLVTQ